MPRFTEAEKEREMASIWGQKQLSKRQEQEMKKVKLFDTTKEEKEAKHQKKQELKKSLLPDAVLTDDDDDDESVISFVSDTALDPAQKKKKQAKMEANAGKKKGKNGEKESKYRLHCFIAPGTAKNDVRSVFEDYGEPDVELRTSQKGNALNKTHFAVMTFKKKTHALFAALHLDGSDQRDSIGMNPMELNIFLSRDQQKLVKKKSKKEIKKKK